MRLLAMSILAIAGNTTAAAEVVPYWINSGLNNRDLTISPDGNLLFSTVMAPVNQFAVIIMSEKRGDQWQPPVIAPFSGRYPDIEPMFSPDGKRLYFSSQRPVNGRHPKDDWDIWVTQQVDGQWQQPDRLGEPVNTDGDEFYPSVSTNGTLYFTSEREGGEGGEDILRAIPENGVFVRIENAGRGVNTKGPEFNAWVAPDESYLLFSSQGREGEIGGGDLYISHRDGDGNFTPARLFHEPINSTRLDYCPYVFGGRLYFTSARLTPIDGIESMAELERVFGAVGNGFGDIYSVSVDEIAEFSR
jgi:hypothetical protein